MKKRTIKRRQFDGVLFTDDLAPVLQRIYSTRGVRTCNELERELENLLPYHSLLGINQAASHLYDAIREQKKILIVGDFDADGATSTAVAIRALKSFGAKNIDYLVPNRFEFGYGLTPELVAVAAKKFSPNVIVTVDNGIANHAGVTAAKKLSIQVIVTDHHLSAETLPEADAIVNPNQPHDAFPSKHIAGVGVIFYLMLALRRLLIERNWFAENNIAEPNMTRLLDLVSLGTVADVVQLDQNNRILVHQGLRRIRASQCVPGIIALLEIASRVPSQLVAADLGFVLGPRLNAAGRLDDMSLGIECLLTDDISVAREIAVRLNQLNEERRVIEHEMQHQALEILKSVPTIEAAAKGICLFDETWHQGVIGILASRIKDRFYRPVIAFACGSGHELKGSARSIPGLHIRDILANIAMKHPQLILKFGGHAMAAGLTIFRENFSTFAKVFSDEIALHVDDNMLDHCLWSDGELSMADLTLELAETLRESGPWGQGFAEPLFDGVFRVVDQRLVGGKHLKLVLSKDEQMFDAITFNVDLNHWPNYRCIEVRAAYRLDINEFRNLRKVQLIVEHLESV